MNRTFSRYLLIGAFVAALGSSASAQSVVTKPTGEPAEKLAKALSTETRDSLQKAMDSMDPTAAPTTATSGTKASAGADEALVLDGKTVEHIPFASLPAPVKSALNGGVRRTLSDSSK